MAGIVFSESSNVAESVFGKSQAPIRSFIEKRAEAYEKESMLPKIFAQAKSTTWGDKYTGMTGMQGFKAIGEGEAIPADEMEESYPVTVENIVFADKFSITEVAIEDAKTMDMKQKPQAFIDGYYRTREEFGSRMYGEAIKGNTSFSVDGIVVPVKTGDGKGLFATDHKQKLKAGNNSNKWADAFSADALAAAETAMQQFEGDNGQLLAIAPDTIMIPNIYSLKKAVFATLGADKDPATANNGFNYLFGRWNVIVNPYLNRFITSGTAPWVLIDSKYMADYSGAVWQERSPLDVRSYVDENTRNNVWTGFARWGAGFTDWRFVSCGGIAGGTQLIQS